MLQSKHLFSLSNKVVIITGATGVLGEAFVKAIADMDGKVALIGRNEKIGNERADSINQSGKEAVFIKADVLSKNDLLKAKNIVLKKWGRIDGLVNAAGGNVTEAVIAPDSDVFEININVEIRMIAVADYKIFFIYFKNLKSVGNIISRFFSQ